MGSFTYPAQYIDILLILFHRQVSMVYVKKIELFWIFHLISDLNFHGVWSDFENLGVSNLIYPKAQGIQKSLNFEIGQVFRAGRILIIAK